MLHNIAKTAKCIGKKIGKSNMKENKYVYLNLIIAQGIQKSISVTEKGHDRGGTLY